MHSACSLNSRRMINKIISMFSAGFNPHEIANNLDISYEDVVNCLSNSKFRFSIFTSVSKDQLEYILKACDNGKMVAEIAKEFNLDRHVVSKILQLYNKKSKHSNRRYDNLRKIPFTKRQKNIIIGSLLGDGCVHKQDKSSNRMYKYYLSHSEKQSDYFFWKFNELKPFFTKYYKTTAKLKTTNKSYKQLKATSIAHPEFKIYHNLFYTDGIKKVPKNIDVYLNPMIMAIWIMDDGSLNKKSNQTLGNNIRICSLNFNYEDHLILKNAIKANFDINTKIGTYTRNSKDFYYISFNKRNSWLLRDIVYDHIIESMKYKFNLSSRKV